MPAKSNNKMTNPTKAFAIFLLLMVIFLMLLGVKSFLPEVLGSVIKNSISEQCLNCTLNFKNIEWHGVNRFEFHEINGFFSDSNKVKFEFKAALLKVDLNWKKLIYRQLQLDRAEFNRLNVTVTETEQSRSLTSKTARSPEQENDGQKSAFSLRVPVLELKNSTLTYIHRKLHAKAKINVKNIAAVLTGFNTNSNIFSDDYKLSLTGTVEDSGQLNIKALWQPSKSDNKDTIEISILNLRLNELDSFFKGEAGITMKGVASKLYTRCKISKGHLNGILFAKYSGFKLTVHGDNSRSNVEAFLGSILASFIYSKSNFKADRNSPIRDSTFFYAKREPDMSIFNFLLGGLIPATQKLIR